MSNRRSNDEYPEHLNPFKRLGLRGSFRELKRNFDIKIRRKEPKKIPNECQVHSTENAPNQERLTHSEVTLRSHDVHQQHKSEIYPRSRFNERANKAQTLAPSSGANPFGEEQNNNNRKSDESSEATKPTDVDGAKPTGKRYRRKKRAPLPPNRLGANTSDLNQSQWSISSYETDCSSTAYNSETAHDEHEPDLNDGVKGLDDIHEISKEIIDYCTSANENTNVSENGVQAKPEIVISDETEILNSAANDEVSDINNKDDKDKSSHNEAAPPCENEENRVDKSDEIIAGDKSGEIIGQADNPEHDQNGAINEQADVLSQEVTEKSDPADINERGLKEVAESNDSAVVEQEDVEKDDSAGVNEKDDSAGVNEKDDHAGVVEKDDPAGVNEQDDSAGVNEKDDAKVEENRNSPVVCVQGILEGNDALVETETETQAVLKNDKNVDEHIHTNGNNNNNNFVETKSLYITGSVDNLDVSEPIVYKEKTALYITGSRDELSANPKGAEKKETPTPKLRKHKFKE